ncbi:MAG: glycosyltransferase [Bacteroidota bacterium]
MPDLSVIIVNYNVKALLEQTLLSVVKATGKLQVETIVVDNHSADGSCEMVSEKFPSVIRIENKDNKGFSKANNQGIQIAKGRHILLLNPDTVVSEDTFIKCIDFLDQHPEAGALGVRMIDGRGKFLPESKRGLPTPAVAFYKMTGLAKLFPKSKTFGTYHLSYLSEFETHEADILSGAFMMIKREVLDKVGLLDETFFMYGEDIDLSYRIVKAGYKNYYFADTTIIHYKGESTKKHSVNYVKIFYQAMAIFAKKHYSKQQGWWFSFCIYAAIYARAFVAVVVRFFRSIQFFVVDFAFAFAGFYGLMRYWEVYNKFVIGGFYPIEYLQFHVPAYILFWLGGIWVSGGYAHPFKLNKIARGVIAGSLALLSVYALLPEYLRFSRALILLGSAWALLITIALRMVVHFIRYGHFDTQASQISQVLIVGSREECERVKQILSNYTFRFKILGFIRPANSHESGDWLGTTEHLPALIEICKANEIVFCARDVSSAEIMQTMGDTELPKVKFKIMPESGDYIIGSNSKNTTGEFYSVDITPALKYKHVQRKKRLADIGFCVLILPLLPLLLFRPSFLKKILGNGNFIRRKYSIKIS